MTGTPWPRHTSLLAHTASIDIVGFSRNRNSPLGLLQDRSALLRSVEGTALFSSALSGQRVIAQFLGDELRIAFRLSQVPADAMPQFLLQVRESLRAGGVDTEHRTRVRAATVFGPTEVRDFHGCAYLVGEPFRTAATWLNSAKLQPGELASDEPYDSWTPRTISGANVYVAPSDDPSYPEPPPVRPSITSGDYRIVVAIGDRGTPPAASEQDFRLQELLAVVDEALAATPPSDAQPNPQFSLGPCALLISLSADSLERPLAFLRLVASLAHSRPRLNLSAVCSIGRLLPVKKPWLTDNFEGSAAIECTRVLASLPPGSLAFAGSHVVPLAPALVGTLPPHTLPGKRDEQYTARVSAGFFPAPGLAIAPPPPGPRTHIPAADPPDIKRVLFDFYEPGCEPWYAVRELDSEIDALAGHLSVWIWGSPGVGKTTAIRRFLARQAVLCHHISLAPCVTLAPQDGAEFLAKELFSLTEGGGRGHGPASLPELLGSTANRLASLKQPTYIHLDEVPYDGQDLAIFSQHLCALLITLGARDSGLLVRFLISTLSDVSPHLSGAQIQVRERLGTLFAPPWSKAELMALLERLAPPAGLSLPLRDLQRIAHAAGGSPRFAKVCLRKLALLGGSPAWSLQRVLDTTREEHGLAP